MHENSKILKTDTHHLTAVSNDGFESYVHRIITSSPSMAVRLVGEISTTGASANQLIVRYLISIKYLSPL